jgi:hypothetical protein
MRLDKNIFGSLNDSVSEVLNDKVPTTDEDIKEIDEADTKLPNVNDLEDKDVADYIIRYNQVVNRALRSRFMSRARRKAI